MLPANSSTCAESQEPAALGLSAWHKVWQKWVVYPELWCCLSWPLPFLGWPQGLLQLGLELEMANVPQAVALTLPTGHPPVWLTEHQHLFIR